MAELASAPVFISKLGPNALLLHAGAIAGLGCPVFACTPEQFPSMMAAALTGKDLASWAAESDIALIRGS